MDRKTLINIDPRLTAGLMILLGIVLIVFPQLVPALLVRLIGVSLILSAIGTFALARKNGISPGYLEVAGAVISAIGGIVLLFAPGFVLSLIPTLLGIFVLVGGITNLLKALDLRRSGYGRWGMPLLMAVLSILAGLFLIFSPMTAIDLSMIAIGVVLIYQGLTALWTFTRH